MGWHRDLFSVRAVGPGNAPSVGTLSNGVRYRGPSTVADAGTDGGAADASADVEAPSDVTATDAGDATIVADAGAAMDASAAVDASASSDARPDASMGTMSGGCGCRIPGGRTVSDGRAALLALAAGSIVLSRRRRASRTG